MEIEMKAKRNPADLTKRNNDARKKEIAELKKQLDQMMMDIAFLAGTCERLRLISEALERKAIQPKRGRK